MERAEKIGLGVATAGHVLLFGLLSAGFLATPNPLKLKTPPMEVSMVDEVALQSTAPQISTAPPPPSIAPEQGPTEDAAPAPEPVPAPEPTPQPTPKEVAKPAPAKPQPAPKKPAPAKKEVAKAKPKPKAAPEKPATKAKATPAKPKAASKPSKPAAKPEAVTPPTNAAACVFFEYLILPASNNKRVAENKTYIVDGPVMIEKIEGEKLVNRIRFAPGEQRQDPLKLGEGPFPLPFGQKREEVLARFNARLVPALETVEVASLRMRLAECYQLVLTPKPNAGISSKVKEVRVWYQKKDLLPTQAIIIRPDGGSDEFFLIGMQVNKPLPPSVFDTTVPAGWRVEEKERP